MTDVFLRKIPPNIPLPLKLNRSARRITTLGIYEYTPHSQKLLLQTVPSLRTLQFYSDPSNAFLSGETRLVFPASETLFVEKVDRFRFSASSHPARIQYPDTHKTSYWPMLDFLRGCPLLKELEIFHDDDFHVRTTHDVAHLPHLRAYGD